MAVVTRGRSAAAEREHHRTNLWAQLARFVGLFLAAFIGLFGSWLIHLWVVGWSIHWGPVNWDVRVSPAAVAVSIVLVTLISVGLAWLGWRFTAHRDPALQGSLAGSIVAIGVLFAINVGTGPHWWWSPLLLVGEFVVALIWSIARLDVARNDKRTDGAEGDGLLDKLGISKLTRFKPKVIRDDEGNPVRIEARVEHAKGETVKVLQDGIDTLESAAAGPPGMSTATSDPDRADRSDLTIMLTDPFKRNLPVGPLTAPGGSIADLTSVADYADGKPAFFTTAAGKHMPSSTSYALIGMTRAGKTGTETQALTEWGSRIDWACLYLNQAKGLQDIRPLLPIIEAAVIAADGDEGLAEYVVAFQKVKAIMAYRQGQLARFGVSAWTPRCADRDPARRPSRVVNGRRVVMESMPFLTVHVGEADAILASGRAGDLAVYITSKGLSLGVNTGWSLQRPDWKSMPTGLRANIGLWFVHGLASIDEEDFALDEGARKAGAHPGRWGQRKPGQHFMTGPGIDESRFPVALKTRFLIGSDRDANGRPYSFDELNARYTAEMLNRNLRSAAGMAKLDEGSAAATDGWWDEQAAKTLVLLDEMLTGIRSEPQTANRKPDRKSSAFAAEQVPQPQTANPAGEVGAEEMEEAVNDFEDDVREAIQDGEVAGVRIFGDDATEEAAIRNVDLTAPRVAGGDDDPLADSDADDKPEAKTAEQARAGLRQALVEMLADPKFADPKRPGTALVRVGDVTDRCPYRTRPWVSGELSTMMRAGGEVVAGVAMEQHGDPMRGQYRLSRTDGDR